MIMCKSSWLFHVLFYMWFCFGLCCMMSFNPCSMFMFYFDIIYMMQIRVVVFLEALLDVILCWNSELHDIYYGYSNGSMISTMHGRTLHIHVGVSFFYPHPCRFDPYFALVVFCVVFFLICPICMRGHVLFCEESRCMINGLLDFDLHNNMLFENLRLQHEI